MPDTIHNRLDPTPVTPVFGRVTEKVRPGAGALLVATSAIQAKYDALGGAATLGTPRERELELWTFDGSCIAYDSRSGHAYEIHGAIYAKWLELGGTRFGTPDTDETGTPDGVGRYNHFNGGTASIYWSPASGAHAIYGAIRDHWSSMGWENSYLGYPTSDEQDFGDGGRANEFQNGGIYFWGDTGAIDLRDVAVRYRGLHCFGETDWDQGSSADEPYAIVAITTPQTAVTVTTPVEGGVDGGESRAEDVEIWRGRPYGLNLGIAMMEHDDGDPNKYRDDIQKAVQAAHEAGVKALNLIPYVGPAVAAIAGPLLGALVPPVAQAISDVLDLGDDSIGTATMTVSARDEVLMASRGQDRQWEALSFRLESPLMSGEGASYKVYFSIVAV